MPMRRTFILTLACVTFSAPVYAQIRGLSISKRVVSIDYSIFPPLVDYSILVTNSGATTTDVPGYELSDQLPSELVLLSASSVVGGITHDLLVDIPNNRVKWDGIIYSGGTLNVKIHTITRPDVPPGTLVINEASFLVDSDDDGRFNSRIWMDAFFLTSTLITVPTLSVTALLLLAVGITIVGARSMR